MVHASESDVFTRSLGGDWQARVKLYKKFVFGNPAVRRLGANYSNLDDFRQDVFTNLLRAGHAFRQDSRLSERVESVAVWTSLERERTREMSSSGTGSVIRMCAAIECDEAGNRARLVSYAPPCSGPGDSMPGRISGIVGEMQFTLIRAAATANVAWAERALAAGKPENTIGPVFVRAVDRLLRLFGAPPPLNPDLETVFHEVSASDAVKRHANPLKPRGRLIPMQLDPLFYLVTPELRKIGLSVPSEVRTITLWDAAIASAPPGEALSDHLTKCRYCADLFRSLMLLQQAMRSETSADFLLCPGASTLLQDSDEDEDAVHQHLAECELCREERARTSGRAERTSAPGPRTARANTGLGKKIAWAVAAALVLCGILIAGFLHFTADKPADTVLIEPVQDDFAFKISDKYADLAQPISIFDGRLRASVLPRNLAMYTEALSYLFHGNRPMGKMIAERVANESSDPGAQTIYAECLFQDGYSRVGYRAIQKAEAMNPRNSFRCWVTLQYALRAGDKPEAERELGHLSSDPDYADPAKAILAKMQARK